MNRYGSTTVERYILISLWSALRFGVARRCSICVDFHGTDPCDPYHRMTYPPVSNPSWKNIHSATETFHFHTAVYMCIYIWYRYSRVVLLEEVQLCMYVNTCFCYRVLSVNKFPFWYDSDSLNHFLLAIVDSLPTIFFGSKWRPHLYKWI